MLEITVKAKKIESYNELTGEFLNFELKHDTTILLEHSLVSISKWESKWHKPFLIKEQNKTEEELKDYIYCMIITPNVPYDIVHILSKENMKTIKEYIENPMTATTFSNNRQQNGLNSNYKKPEIMTSELIYYWMIEGNIPPEYQKWHLNRLLTLIRVCNIKNSSNNKMSKRDTLMQNRSLNQARRAKYSGR